MKSIGVIIASLSDKEEKDFYEFISKKGKDKESLPLKLFEIYRKDYNKTENQILKELGIKETNYFYQIRHRLKSLLEDFVLNLSIESAGNYFTEVSNNINIAHYLRNKNLHEKALKALLKAEKICEQNSDFELLVVVYSHMLSIAQVYPEIEVYEIVEKQINARKKAEIFNQLEVDYSTFKYELYKSNYSLPPSEIIAKLDNYLKKFHLYDLTKLESFNLQYKVLSIIMEVMIYNEDTYDLFKQYEQNFLEWDKQLLFNKRNIEKKLSITYRMCLYLLRQFRFEECNTYLERFYNDLQLPEAEALGSYLLLYYQVKTVVFAYTGKVSNAIFATLDILERNLINNRIDVNFIFLFNLANFYFINGNYENSLDTFLKLEKRKNFAKYLTDSVRMDINIYKAMIMIMLNNKDVTLIKNLEQESANSNIKIHQRKKDFMDILIYISKNKDLVLRQRIFKSY
ncbi:MAG: hypothetical protein KatS3mg035_0597 [Bacteroidia bacterium]|nr:MAG: hypothetical protein KatS3mg035_0597 [Bacteroidia bacterium]